MGSIAARIRLTTPSAPALTRSFSILYGEAHGLTTEGFRVVVGSRHRIVGTARDGLDLVGAAFRLKPDLVVLAITMPRLNGIEAARQIKARLDRIKVLFLTRHEGFSYIQAAMNAGADGYMLKSDEPECLLDAIESVMAGQLYLSPQLSADWLAYRQGPRLLADKLELTPRERQILQQIAEGHGGKQIAWALGISVKTVAHHREHIKEKLGMRTTADLTRSAMELGLIPPLQIGRAM